MIPFKYVYGPYCIHLNNCLHFESVWKDIKMQAITWLAKIIQFVDNVIIQMYNKDQDG